MTKSDRQGQVPDQPPFRIRAGRIAVLIDIGRQRLGPIALPPVVPAGMAHRSHEPLLGITHRPWPQDSREPSSRAPATVIISIEKGLQNASAITLVRLAAALGVLPAELFRTFTKHVMRSVS
jgi:hypothetical protein